MLPDDVHWYIFMMNAADSSTRQESRLLTSLASSQVCGRWRRIILGSSSIWGKLVLIKRQQRIEWLEEILRRSGNSSLWIKCIPEKKTLRDAEEEERHISVLVSVLESYWDRIEKLYIDDSIIDRLPPTAASPNSGRILNLLRQPAPILRSLRISFRTTSSSISLDSSFFCNCAPLLLTFKACNITFPKTPEYIPWFANIRDLRLNPAKCSAKSLLHVLSTTSLLESLEMIVPSHYRAQYRYNRRRQSSYYYDNEDNEYICGDTLPMIDLPQLTRIKGKLLLHVFIALWRRISAPPQGVAMDLIINVRTRHCSTDLMERFPEALSNLMNQYILDISGNTLPPYQESSDGIQFRVNGYKAAFTFTKNSFYFRFSQLHTFITVELAAQLIASFSAYIAELPILRLRIRPQNPEVQYPGLKQMFHCMKSVSTLIANVEAFDFLCNADSKEIGTSTSIFSVSTFLPLLKSLQILPLDTGHTNPDLGHLLQFIQCRISSGGQALSTIRVPEGREHAAPYLEALHHVPNLRIFWLDKDTGEKKDFVLHTVALNVSS